MRLLRNTTKDGKCKYSLIEHEKDDHVESGLPKTENEFFVIKLKDKYAKAALEEYDRAVSLDPGGDKEYDEDVLDLADRAGTDSPWCKRPD